MGNVRLGQACAMVRGRDAEPEIDEAPPPLSVVEVSVPGRITADGSAVFPRAYVTGISTPAMLQDPCSPSRRGIAPKTLSSTNGGGCRVPS